MAGKKITVHKGSRKSASAGQVAKSTSVAKPCDKSVIIDQLRNVARTVYDIEDIEDQLSVLSNILNKLEEILNELEGDDSSTEATLLAVKDCVCLAKDEIVNTNSNLVTVNNTLNSIISTLNSLDTSVGDVETAVNTVNSSVGDVETAVNTVNSSVQAVEAATLKAQQIDNGNTKVISSSDASPGSPWIGSWTQTRTIGVKRLLTVLASNNASVGGTFTFEFTESTDPNTDHPTLGTAEISEQSPIGDFDTVRDFDLLNAGGYFRVAFEPASPLASDLVFATTTLRFEFDGPFVRLANQEVEEANAAMPQTFSYQKVFDNVTGKSVNVRDLNNIHTDNVPSSLDADEEFLGGWVDIRQLGHFLFLIAGIEDFDTVQFQWSTDGVNPNGLVTNLTNKPVSTGALNYNVYFDVLNIFVSGRFVRARIVNGSTPQSSPILVGICTSGRFPYSPLIGLTDNLSFLSEAILTRAVLSATRPDGTFTNIAASIRDSLHTKQEGVEVTPSGSIYSQGFIPYIRHDFGVEGIEEINDQMIVVDGSGSHTHDLTDGGMTFQTSSTPGSSYTVLSAKKINYSLSPGHGVQLDQTLFKDPASITIDGDAKVEWGLCKESGPTDGFGYGYDATGLYVWMRKGGSDVFKEYQSDWNADKCDGSEYSKFVRANEPEVLSFDLNNLYRIQSEFLYAAEQIFKVKAPNGIHIETHINEYPNSATVTSLKSASMHAFVKVSNDTTNGGIIVVRSGSWSGGIFTSQSIQIGRDPNDELTEVRSPGVLNNNSTTDLLDGDQVYRGTWFRWSSDYIKLASLLKSDVPGTLFIDFSDDVAPTDGDDSSVDDSVSVSYDPNEIVLIRRHTPVQSVWVRHRYVNGPTAQAEFSLLGVLLTSDVASPMAPLRVIPNSDNLANLVRAVLAVHDSNDEPMALLGDSTTGSINTSIEKHSVDTPIATMASFEVGQGVANAQTAVTIPAPSISNVKAISIANLSNDIRLWMGTNGVSRLNGDVIFPVTKEHFEADGSKTISLIADPGTGATAQHFLEASTVSNSANVTSPTNLLTNTGTDAIFIQNGSFVDINGFNATGVTALDEISSLVIEMDGRKNSSPATQTVTFRESQTGTTAGATSVSSASLAGGTDQLYVAFVSRNALNNVSNMSGGGKAFIPLIVNQETAGKHMDVWYANGNFTAGAVTANMSSSTNAHIVVVRVDGHNPTTPFEDFSSTSGTGTAVTGPNLNKTALGLGITGVSHEAASATPGAGYTERADVTVGAGSNTNSLAVQTKAFVTTGTEAATMTLSGSSAWLATSVRIQPAVTKNPIVTITNDQGATVAQFTLTNTSNQTFTESIVADVDGFADIDAMTLHIETSNVGDATALISRVRLNLVEAETGVSVRFSYKWLSED